MNRAAGRRRHWTVQNTDGHRFVTESESVVKAWHERDYVVEGPFVIEAEVVSGIVAALRATKHRPMLTAATYIERELCDADANHDHIETIDLEGDEPG